MVTPNSVTPRLRQIRLRHMVTMHRSTRPVNLSSGTSTLLASYLTCLETGTRQQQLENVPHSPDRRQSWLRLGNDGSDLPVSYILYNPADHGFYRLDPCWRWKWNLGVGMQQPFPGVSQTLSLVTGIPWLQQLSLIHI